MARRIPVEELVDLEALREEGDPPHELHPARLRQALPRGWVLEADGRHARRDGRLFFRESWVLVLGLVAFGSVGGVFLWGGVPRGVPGLVRLALLVVVLIVVGGVVAPWITRALQRR